MNKSEIDNRKRKNKTLTKLNYVLMMFCQFFCWHLNSIRGTLDDFSWSGPHQKLDRAPSSTALDTDIFGGHSQVDLLLH